MSQKTLLKLLIFTRLTIQVFYYGSGTATMQTSCYAIVQIRKHLILVLF